MTQARRPPSNRTPPPREPADTRGVNREHAELERQGAKAAARGEALASNPMSDSINQPGTTGESQQVWSGRRDAWNRGHDTQRAPRGASAPEDASASASPRVLDEALFAVTRILTFAGARSMTSASGFFFRRDDRLFLVTSRHVFFDEPTEHRPDRIEIQLHVDARDLTRQATLSILLYRDELANWRQAEDSGGGVDVAALELDPGALPAGSVFEAFSPAHLPAGFDLLDVGDRLAIPGFPLGFFDTLHQLPVVRSASVASMYGVRFQGQGYFLTDARMHRGSSGSPVLARIEAGEGGEGSRPRWCLVGVHSSRMDMATRDEAVDESLGLNCAWYSDMLMTLTDERL